LPIGIARALKAGGGSGNIPKVILEDNVYFTVEDGHENCIDYFTDKEMAIKECIANSDTKEVFKFKDDELIECVYRKYSLDEDNNENILPAALKYQRTEYAKKIRKDYEAGRIKERRCNMREYTLRTDGLCNTITTVTKDNYIIVGAAMRGRYNSDGKTEQKIEVRNDELSNAITTVQKDSLVVKNFQNPPTD